MNSSNSINFMNVKASKTAKNAAKNAYKKKLDMVSELTLWHSI